jgi:hypothetical protein
LAHASFGIDNLCTDLIQEFSIVTHNHHWNILLSQELFEPFDTFKIKMIGLSQSGRKKNNAYVIVSKQGVSFIDKDK